MENHKPFKTQKNKQKNGNVDLAEDFIFTPLSDEPMLIKHSDVFQKQGEKLLSEGDSSAVKYFEMAVDLDPNNPDLFYEQGIAFFELGYDSGREKNLHLASQKFKKATKLDAQHFDAWFAWGQTLLKLGITFKKHHYFLEAKRKFEKAISISTTQDPDSLAELYWQFGLTSYNIALQSQEVSDLNEALEAFSNASRYSAFLPSDFWCDFGLAYEKVGAQINDSRLFAKSIDCFKRAVDLDRSSCKNWYHLAKSLSNLYSYTHDEDHYSQANECFSTAAQIDPENVPLWNDWGKVLFDSGKRLEDTKRLFSSIEKFHRAYSCDPFHLESIALWSEALSMLGLMLDRIDLIYDAENKINEITHYKNIGPEVFHALGFCYYSYGCYYEDVDYFYQAAEKFQQGLSINRAYHKLWFALGINYSQAAELESNPQTLELSCKFFSRAINLQAKSEYYFEYALAMSKLGEFHGDQQSLEYAIYHFEKAINLQKNAIYLHPEWLYQYAVTLDALADHTDSSEHYQKAIEILSHVLVLDPEHPEIHHRLGLCYSHYGELCEELSVFQRAVYHYKLAYKKNDENELVLLDWALTLINMAEIVHNPSEENQLFSEAEYKIIKAAKLGNIHAYYHLACLYSITKDLSKSLYFLEKAQQFQALPSIDEILHDSWLENLRDHPMFQEFISKIEKSADSA